MSHPNQDPAVRQRVSWREVWTLYERELRSAFRERVIIVNSILIPIFLYPLIMWGVFSGIMFVQGQSERAISRVHIERWPEGHPRLRTSFERNRNIQIMDEPMSAAAAEEAVANGDLDVYVRFVPAEGAAESGPENFQALLWYNGGQDRSAEARDRVRDLVETYRREWIEREAQRLGIGSESWDPFSVEMKNVASRAQMGGFILGLVLPIIFTVMVAIGCFYPAVDCIAGERERNTWETLMSSAASRGSIMTAKYLYVTTLGGLAGALNLAAMALTVKPIFGPMFSRAGIGLDFNVPSAAVPVFGLAAVLLAAFVAAGMMIFASFARTFKEGQSLITPFYMLVMLPSMFVQVPGLKFTPALAMVPVVNVTMMVRSAVAGVLPWLSIALTVVVSLLLIALCLRATTFVLKFEDVLIGSYSGNIRRFVRERIFRRERSIAKRIDSTPPQ